MKKHVLTALLLCLALCLPALAAADEATAKPMMDVVWLIDTTGSIGSSRISAIKNQMDDFAAQLADFDVRYSLVAFGDEANDAKESGYDFPEETVWLTMGSSHWTNSCETLKSYIEQGEGKLPKYLGGDGPETSTNAIYKTAEWIGRIEGNETWRDGALRQFVLVTDAEPKASKSYTVQGKSVFVYAMQQAIDDCIKSDISVSVASLSNSIENAYKDLVEKTGGKYQYVGGSTTIASSIGEWISNTPVVITQPVDQYVHDGDKVQFFAETLSKNNVSYTWYGILNDKVKFKQSGNTSYDSNQFLPLSISYVSPSINGTVFHCVFTNTAAGDGRSVESNKVTLFVVSKFAITSHPQNVTTDAGQTAEFTVVATGDGLTYQWQKQNGEVWTDLSGATAATLSIPATLADNGSVYRCVIKDAISDKQPGGYTLTSNSATLTVVAAPAITGHPQNVTTEAGKDATFTVQATGTGLTYQWQQKNGDDWVNLSGATGTTLTVTATTENSGSVYRCRVTSIYGTVAESQPATLTVVAAPAITGHPQNVTTEAGKDATFTVTATGTGLTYQWQQKNGDDWDDLSGATGTTLTVTATTENSGSVYRCRVTSSYGTVAESQPAALTVDGAPAITGQPESVVVTEGENASFTVTATGEGLTYQWQVYRDGVWMDCTDGQSPTLTLSGLTLADDGQTYRCVITSSYGTTVISDTVTLTVVAKVELPQTGDSSRPWLWLTLMCSSLLGLTILRRRRA